MGQHLFDLREAVRGFRRSRSYVIAVVGTLALTLGATTAVFSIVDGVLLRPLAYPEAGRLVAVREVVLDIANRYPTLPVNARHFEEWRRRSSSWTALAELDWRTTNLTGAGEPARLVSLRASGTLFDVLRLRVAKGRPLTQDDERPERPAVAVVSDALWRDRLGRDPNVLGRSLTLGGAPFAIVGVLPPGVELPRLDVLGDAGTLTSAVDVIVPMRINLANVDWMGQFNYSVIGRLKDGVSLDTARREMNDVQRAVGEIAARETHEQARLGAWMSPLDETIVGRARLGLLLLLGAVAGVVLIACSNLANLTLTRTIGRAQDLAVRTALGASRGRLIRQAILEQLVLAAAGGGLGLLVAREALTLFVRTAPIDLPRVGDVAIDGRVLAFAAGLTIAAGLAVAVVSAWYLARRNAQHVLRAASRTSTDRGGSRTRASLLGAQVAIAVTLLGLTGLFVTSVFRLTRVDPGFSADQVVAIEFVPLARRYPDAPARATLYDQILARVQELPAVTSASMTSALPLTGETWVDLVARLGDVRPSSELPSANYRFVGPDYFRTLSMPLLEGRSPETRDRASRLTPAVISARAARTLWPDQDPIGRQIHRGNPDEHFEVVGVVADGHATALDAQSPLMVYVPYWYNNEGKSILVVRARETASALVGVVRAAIQSVDPEIAIAEAAPLQSVVDKAIAGRRYQMWLFVAFGLVAIVIAAVGVYAATAYSVSRRRREMNIRVALGAPASGVFWLVVRQSATPVAIGLAAGCAGALAAGMLVRSLLYDVRAGDPAILIAAIAFVGLVGFSASTTATRQGLQIDPAAALRDE